SFGEEQPPDMTRPEADRAQQTYLPAALLDAELEEQRCEHERGDYEEETEIDEVLTEIGGTPRRAETLVADIAHGKAECERVGGRTDAGLEIGARRVQRRVGCGLQSHRG